MNEARQLQTVLCSLRFELFTAVFLKTQLFWDVKLCCWFSSSQHFEGTWFLQLHGLALKEEQTLRAKNE
jgi:hypothetical protein